jgi:hypothetical protein
MTCLNVNKRLSKYKRLPMLSDRPGKLCEVPDVIMYVLILITYYCYYYYLLKLSFYSVAVVLTLIQTKQIRINEPKRNNTKTQYKQYKTQ